MTRKIGDGPQIYRCSECFYRQTLSAEGAMEAGMPLGTTYCTAKKHLRRFRPTELKTIPPKWCPKLKHPCEVRIFSFKSERDWSMHQFYCKTKGRDNGPDGFRYYVREEFKSDLTPRKFWAELDEEDIWDLLETSVSTYDVIEIDDGLDPVCFYLTEAGLKMISYFNSDQARRNKKEE